MSPICCLPVYMLTILKLSANTAAAGPFGLGSHIFGTEKDVPESGFEGFGVKEDNPDPKDEGAEAGEDEDEEDDEDEELVTAMATATLDTSPWASAPRYSSLYMSTTAEYLPPTLKSSIPVVEEAPEEDGDGKKGKDVAWAMEGYENSMDVDHAFERFSKRVGYEAEQCIRYVIT